MFFGIHWLIGIIISNLSCRNFNNGGNSIYIYLVLTFIQNERPFCTRHDTRGPTCRVQKNSHFATCFIQFFFFLI
jgi:hypothetical protein